MKALVQPELPVRSEAPLFEIREDHPNIEWLIELLDGRDWTPVDEILKAAQKPISEYNKRWVRKLAQRSKGRVGGGQNGYKLIRQMTSEEYQRWRNWMKSQADEMTARILQADKVFYRRQAVASGNGILSCEEGEGGEVEYAI